MTGIPINCTENGKASTVMAGYFKYGIATLVTNKSFKGGANAIAVPIPRRKERDENREGTIRSDAEWKDGDPGTR